MGDFLFGSSGSDPKPFRGKGWKQQGNLLNQFAQGQIFGLFPELGSSYQSNLGSLGNQISDIQNQIANYSGGSDTYNSRTGTGGYGGGSGLADLNSQLANLQSQYAQAQQFSNLAQNNPFSEYMQTPDYSGLPELQALSFQARNPYEYNFAFDPEKALTDTYTPQMEALKSLVANRGAEERTAITDDYNRRGLGTSGAGASAITRQLRDEGDRLANASASLGAQQAQAKMAAYQFQAQMEQQRQLEQAAEIFRQQGASDQQALQLAQDALMRRQQGFGERQQMFQNKQGLRQSVFDDLLRLYGLSTGATPGTEASPGLFQGLAGGVGQGLGVGIGGLFF